MYICNCNALTDKQISAAVAGGADRPREVYAACGCKAQCGCCTGTILAMVREGGAARAG
ncbi:(2Fe-2S)-binding protein [Falsiroseomonas sp. CW058]|uniref:(2Fe-2S)-binding protein n=1 Tax=Falsiroseomonas sp. CW058 TaxID=3388664 RepID=UPI003D30F4FF